MKLKSRRAGLALAVALFFHSTVSAVAESCASSGSMATESCDRICMLPPRPVSMASDESPGLESNWAPLADGISVTGFSKTRSIEIYPQQIVKSHVTGGHLVEQIVYD